MTSCLPTHTPCAPLAAGATAAQIIRHFQRCALPSLDAELKWFATQRTLLDAIKRAAVARGQRRRSLQWVCHPKYFLKQKRYLSVGCHLRHMKSYPYIFIRRCTDTLYVSTEKSPSRWKTIILKRSYYPAKASTLRLTDPIKSKTWLVRSPNICWPKAEEHMIFAMHQPNSSFKRDTGLHPF